MLRRLTLALLSVCAAVVLLQAQSRPDFSGRWTTEPEAGGTTPGTAPGQAPGTTPGQTPGRGGGRGPAIGDLGSGWGPTITVTQNANSLTVEYAFFARGDMQPPLKFVYALDGSETKNTVMMGRGMQTQTSKAAWDGSALVITTLHPFTDPSTGKPSTVSVQQKLTLESPASLVVETTRAGVLGGPPSTARATYRKL